MNDVKEEEQEGDEGGYFKDFVETGDVEHGAGDVGDDGAAGVHFSGGVPAGDEGGLLRLSNWREGGNPFTAEEHMAERFPVLDFHGLADVEGGVGGVSIGGDNGFAEAGTGVHIVEGGEAAISGEHVGQPVPGVVGEVFSGGVGDVSAGIILIGVASDGSQGMRAGGGAHPHQNTILSDLTSNGRPLYPDNLRRTDWVRVRHYLLLIFALLECLLFRFL